MQDANGELQENLDFLMVCAVDIELKTYGTIRMVKQFTQWIPGYVPQPSDYQPGLIAECGGYYETHQYFFELQNVDFEVENPQTVEIWEMITAHQVLLAPIFERLEKEGVGFNPYPPENATEQSMTWFYPPNSLQHLTGDPQFVSQSVGFLRSCGSTSDFQDSQRVAALITFAKHLCSHEWEGESESWTCSRCNVVSYLAEKPAA